MDVNELDTALAACRKVFVAVFLFGLGINLLALTSPLYTMQIFDHVIASRSTDTLVLLSLIVLIAFGVWATLDGVRSAILARLGNWLDYRLGPQVLARLVNDANRSAGRGNAGGMQDLATLKSFFTGPVIGSLMDAPWSPIFIVALFLLSPWLGVVGILGIAVLAGLALLNGRLTNARIAHANRETLAIGRDTEASLRNAEVIRVLGMTEAVVERWRRGTDRVGLLRGGATDRSSTVVALSKFARIAVQSAVMGTGAYLVLQQELGPGAMMAASILLGRALAPVENAIASWKTLIDAREARRRLIALLASSGRSEKLPVQMLRPRGQIELENISFTPPGRERPVLQDISLALSPGEVLGVVGPSAAGKSSLAKLITGAWLPTAGHVRIDGLDVGHWHAAGAAASFGYLPQDVELFSGTVGENIARLGHVDSASVIEAAQLAGFHDAIMRMAQGYDTEIGEDGLKLSGGQRQRLGLARALFGMPALLVLDEPNASLDSDGERALVEAIRALKARGTTVVVIAHRTRILAQADKLLVLRDGRIEAFGSTREVLAMARGAEKPIPVMQPIPTAPEKPAMPRPPRIRLPARRFFLPPPKVAEPTVAAS